MLGNTLFGWPLPKRLSRESTPPGPKKTRSLKNSPRSRDFHVLDRALASHSAVGHHSGKPCRHGKKTVRCEAGIIGGVSREMVLREYPLRATPAPCRQSSPSAKIAGNSIHSTRTRTRINTIPYGTEASAAGHPFKIPLKPPFHHACPQRRPSPTLGKAELIRSGGCAGWTLASAAQI